MAKSDKGFDKKNLVAYHQEITYQQKIDEAKLEIRDTGLTSKVELAVLFDQLRTEEEKLSKQLDAVKLKQEAITQMVVDILDEEGITKFTLPDGRTFYQEQKVYPSIQNRDDFHKWIRSSGLDELFTVNYQTAASLIKERLEIGEELPPGTAAFLKTALRRRKPTTPKENF